jgi:hypothetical protein
VHRFVFYPSEKKKMLADLPGAHLIGADGIPVRGDIQLANGEIRCAARSSDPFGLSLLWPVEGFGTVQLETTRLPARDKPYILNLELARHRLMRITLKREEWGLFDYHGMDEIGELIDRARDLFIQAWGRIESPKEAAELADQSLRLGLEAGERMSAFHATVFLGRRQQSGGFAKEFLGAAVIPAWPPSLLTPAVRESVDFLRLPFTWRDVQPKEQEIRFERLDAWLEAAEKARLPVRGGPLLNFGVQFVPDWMYIWENDFDTILEYARAHVQRCVRRYADRVGTWVAASGLHADNVFSLNFEQVMEITRMAAGAVKEIAPRSQVVIDLTQPWGEYSAHSQRSIPPLLFADMAVQGGVPFDAFGLQFLFGIPSEGYHLRDLLQISSLIDKIANLGRPLHVTAVAVPSVDGAPGNPVAAGGAWKQPWSGEVQAEWLAAFCEVSLSKPYVDSVCLEGLADNGGATIPSGGLLTKDFGVKPACTRLAQMVRQLHGNVEDIRK